MREKEDSMIVNFQSSAPSLPISSLLLLPPLLPPAVAAARLSSFSRSIMSLWSSNSKMPP